MLNPTPHFTMSTRQSTHAELDQEAHQLTHDLGLDYQAALRFLRHVEGRRAEACG